MCVQTFVNAHTNSICVFDCVTIYTCAFGVLVYMCDDLLTYLLRIFIFYLYLNVFKKWFSMWYDKSSRQF